MCCYRTATKEALVFTKAFFVILFVWLERATSIASCRKIISPVEILLTEGADFVATLELLFHNIALYHNKRRRNDIWLYPRQHGQTNH